MTDRSRLTESEIRRWIGETSFTRGQRYYHQGYILNPRRQGQILRGRCLGSRPQPYRVEILLRAESIVAGECSCPVGGGGRCKHAAALLLTWLHDPDTFQAAEDLEAALQRRSKAELVPLISKMIQRYPDLGMLLELPTAGGPEASRHLDPELIRRQVDAAFSRAGHNWEAASRVAVELQDVVDLGDEYAQHQKWPSAATVYETVARGVLGNYHEMYDEEGDLSYLVYRCAEGLVQCFEAVEDPAQREGLLRALFDVYRWYVDASGYRMRADVPAYILTLANKGERRLVSEWVRAVLDADDSRDSSLRRREYGGFLLELLITELDDESFLQICRETGRRHDLVDRLLSLNRIDEAMVEARSAGDYDLLRLADLFVLHSRADLGEQIIRERDETSNDSRLTTWRKARAEDRGDLEEALALAGALFWGLPSLPAYQEMGRLAQRLNRWDSVREESLTRLQEDENFALLTEIHLLEGDLDRALETLEELHSRSPWRDSSLSLKVAQAAERIRPCEAIRLYLAEAELLIARRGRGKYAKSATYLLHVRTLLVRMGEEKAWQALIADLREENPRLPAMQDEFNRAGL